jgi:glycosyltransferase involved in cell wall biosynthesis
MSQGGTKVRVWIVNHYAIPPMRAGGTRHYSLACALVKRGHQVTIIASSFEHYTHQETRLAPGDLYKVEVIDGITFVWLRTPSYSGNTFARMWNMLVFAWRVYIRQGIGDLPKPDLIWGSSPHLFGALAAERVAARLKVPFVLEVRDLWPQSLIDLGNVSARHPVARGLLMIERYLYRRAKQIISLLQGAPDHMVAKGACRDKIAWIPNGVDVSLFPETAPLPHNPVFIVMYAGAHGLANALDPILDAAGILQREGYSDRVRFRLIGDGPAKAGLCERAAAEGTELVQFENPVPKVSIFETLSQADAFVVSMKASALYQWGISLNKVFDYLACGRPIIFAGDSPYNQVAAAEAGITVPPENGRAIAEAVKQLLTQSMAEREAMGARGRRHVEEFYSMDVLGDRLERVLGAALGK